MINKAKAGAAKSCGIDGVWNIQGSTDESACGEGIRSYFETANVKTSGNKVSITVHNHTVAGTLSGSNINYKFKYPEDGGTTSGSGSVTINENITITGSANWKWSGSGFSCSGTDTFSGTKK